MAHRQLTTGGGPLRSIAARWSNSSDWVRIAVIYGLARIVTTAFLLGAAAMSTATSRFGADASIADFVLGWDAQWYWLVAVNGYPGALPLTDAGTAAENQWAFMPVFAYIAHTVGAPFGAWGFGALVVSLVAGYLSCVVLYRLLRMRQGSAAATWAVAFFASAPLAALFQVGYAESLFLLWLFLSLWCVQRRQFGWLYLLIPLMGYTRPGVLAFALYLGLFGIWRWCSREREPLSGREVTHIIALGALAVVIGFSWQVLAGLITGDPGAYLATELAWRRNWIADASGAFVPFEGWVQAAAFWFGTWGLGATGGYIALTAGLAAVAALLLFEPHVKKMGVESRLWAASYLVYLLAVFFPQSSVFRLLVPLSPLWGAVAAPTSTLYRLAVLSLCLFGQWWWIFNMYALGNNYWQVP